MIAGDHIENIIRYIGFLRNEVELKNQINLYDINIHLEYLLSDLLNLMYDFALVNKNTVDKNATAIDLFDDKNRIAVQITSDNKSDKIKETLDKFYKQQYDKKYDKLIHLILTKKKDYTTPFETNSRNGNLFFKFEIKDTFDLITEIRAFNADKIAILASFLHRNLAYSLNWQPKSKANEVDTIIKLVAFLSNNAIESQTFEENIDPNFKIRYRFAEHADFLEQQYLELAQVYYIALKEVEAKWANDTVKARKISWYLKILSNQYLNKQQNDPQKALNELVAFFEAKISEEGMAFDLMAIYFYLIHQTINCNVFPNPVTS